MLTLRTLGISGSGSVIGSYSYQVVGLPAGRGAMLARLSGVWKILKIEPGKNYAWTGSFVSADDALTSLEGDVDTSRLRQGPRVTSPDNRPYKMAAWPAKNPFTA